MEPKTKQCTGCDKVKELQFFYQYEQKYYFARCKVCCRKDAIENRKKKKALQTRLSKSYQSIAEKLHKIKIHDEG